MEAIMSSRNKWKLKHYFICGVFSAATFAISFLLGGAITASLGPGTSGIVTIVITTILVIICARIVELPGAMILVVTLYTLFAIPTTMFGPPGLPKVIIGFLTGLIYDFVITIGKRKKWSYPIAAFFATAISIILIFYLLVILDHPRADYLRNILYYAIPLYVVLGFIGAIFGNWLYDKNLLKLDIIKSLK